MTILAFAWALAAEPAPRPELDLEPWRRILVHAERSRIKPLDSFARESCVELFGRQFFAPKHFETLSATDVKDWAAVAAALAAPPADAPAAPPRADGRTDRFKGADPGDPSPRQRLRDLLSVEDRKLLRDTDFAAEPKLRQAYLDAEKTALAARRKVFERDSADRSLEETRAAAAAAGDANAAEVLRLLDACDAAKAQWLPALKARARLLTVFNALLGFANLYEPASWGGVKLPEEAAALVKEGPAKLPPHRLFRLNRFLLSSALGDALAPPGTPGRADPEAKTYDPTEASLTLIFSWAGWDDLAAGTARLEKKDVLPTYLRKHPPDGWDRVAWMQAGHVDLAPLLLPETDLLASVRSALSNPSFFEHFEAAYVRLKRDEDRAEAEGKDRAKVFERLPNADQRAMQTMRAAEEFVSFRTGMALGVAPPDFASLRTAMEPNGRAANWVSLAQLLGDEPLGEPYASAGRAALRKSFFAARAAFLDRDAAKFAAASRAFAAGLEPLDQAYAAWLQDEGRKLNRKLASALRSKSGLNFLNKLDEDKEWDRVPDAGLIDTELFYNRFDPFWKAFGLAAGGFFVGLLGLAVRPRFVYWLGYALLVAAVGTMAWGLVLRSQISGRAPVVEFFDTVVWAGAVCGALGAFMGLRWPVAAVATSALLAMSNSVSVNLPLEFGVGMKPIQPVLRSEKWLYIHVMTIVASYGAFMLAWLLSAVGLGFHLFGKEKSPHCKALGLLTYRTMLVGVLLLAAGTFLGGWWASDAWGRFWGWDPKETFALVALLTYLAVLHSRFVGVKNYGTMVGSTLAFTMVLASWYGVNFILKAGKHAYAFNTGGQWYVIGGVLANLAYVTLVHVVKTSRRRLPETAALAAAE